MRGAGAVAGDTASAGEGRELSRAAAAGLTSVELDDAGESVLPQAKNPKQAMNKNATKTREGGSRGTVMLGLL